ncbi:unnamed protein product [Adineta ricciae]|uniref:Uncharacterized protein n=1 Tax=Adineta ricciae TaxID=249248 RepID=A0A816HNA1_ADIRI|nr:unnamed protein product [Adineta ricciae]
MVVILITAPARSNIDSFKALPRTRMDLNSRTMVKSLSVRIARKRRNMCTTVRFTPLLVLVANNGTMGMIISVLGESYQRVYKQQTYDPNEQEPLLVDWDHMNNVEEEKEQNMTKNLATRSKLNFSISSNDGNIDDQLANQIIKHLNEKIIEIQEIIHKDIYLQMIDSDNQKPVDSSVNTSLRYFRL